MLQYRAASFISIQALYDYKNEPKKEFVPEKQPAPEKKASEPSFLSGVE